MDEFSFSEWLEAELKRQNMTYTELARRTYMTPLTISNYVRCMRFPNICTVNDILNALGKKIVIVDKEEKA